MADGEITFSDWQTLNNRRLCALDSAVVDPGEKEFQLGLTYVALSRVRSIESLALENSYDFARFSSIGGTNMMRLRKLEEARLRSLSNQIV